MAIREIRYNVTSSGVTPATHQWGGVQNEDNATEISYYFDAEYLSKLGNTDDLRFRIDFNSSSAGYDPSESLGLIMSSVTRKIPQKMTQYGGQMQCTLVISRIVPDSLPEVEEEILQIPSTLFFTASNRQDKRFNKNLSAYEEYVSGLISEVAENVSKTEENAKQASSSAEEAKESETKAERYVSIAENSAETAQAQVRIIEQKVANGEFGYTLTESDKEEIAEIIKAEMFVDVSEVAR